MVTFVLVHGAWLWASAWNRVAQILDGKGHRVIVPCLTGLGEKSDLLTERVDLNTHIADVASCLASEDRSDFILVGHGYAGMIISAVANIQPHRIAQLVYLDAYVPSHQRSAWDLIPALLQRAFVADAQAGGDGWRLPPIERYFTAWGLAGAHRDLVRANATDFSLRCLQTRLDLPMNHAAALPRSFVCATRPYPARRLFETFEQQARNDGWPIYAVESGHVIYLEQPAALAEVLDAIAARRGCAT